MKEDLPSRPYTPSWVHKLFSWIDQLPGAYWLFYIGIILITGLLNHIVAWQKQVLAPGEINWYFASTAFFFAYWLFLLDFNFRIAKESLEEFLPVLADPEETSERIMFEFTHLPVKGANVAIIIGLMLGIALLVVYQLPTATEINYAFPELEVIVFCSSTIAGWLLTYALVRASYLISRVFKSLEKVDLYDLNSIHAMSKYSASYIILIMPSFLIFVLAPSLVEVASIFIVVWVLMVVAVVFILFWLPLRYVNRKLVLEKRRLLRDVNLHIKDTFELLHTKIEAHDYKDIEKLREVIDSLKKEKDFIEAISTWPWKQSTLTGMLSAIVAPLLIVILSEIINRFF